MDTYNNQNANHQAQHSPTQVNPNARKVTPTQVNPNATGGGVNSVKQGRPGTMVNPNAAQNNDPNRRSTSNRIPVGTVVDGRYSIRDAMTSNGAEAELYVCVDLETSSELCIKFYLDSDHVRENVRATLMGINHRNISTLIAWGNWEGRSYEVWSLYKGQNLAEIIRQGRLSQALINTYLLQMNDALHELHSHGLVHQDIKPSNFIVMADNTVVLIDFGISAIGREGGTHVTKVGNTTDYSPYEVLFSNFCWPASDYYSLGVTVYEMLFGTTPYSDYDESMVYRKHDDMHDNRIPRIERLSAKEQDLIVGLLQYDHKVRWGYEAVQAWLFGNYDRYKRPVHSGNQGQQKGFTFSGQTYLIPSQIPELVTSMAFNWRDGLNFLDDEGRFVRLRDLLNGIEGTDELWSICNEKKPDRDTDLFYFRRLYKLYPQLSVFAWRGFTAKGPKELGLAILNAIWQHEIKEETQTSAQSTNPFNPFDMSFDQKNDELTYADLEDMFKKHVIPFYLNMRNEINQRDQILAYEGKLAEAWNRREDTKVWYYKIGYALSGSTKLRLGPTYYENKDAFVKQINTIIDECKSSDSNSSFLDFCRLIYDGKMNSGFVAWAEAQGFGYAVRNLENALKEGA